MNRTFTSVSVLSGAITALILASSLFTSCGTAHRAADKQTTPVTTNRNNRGDRGHGQAAAAESERLKDEISGEWQIIRAGDKKVAVTDDMPYVNFDVPTGSFYASDGCNILNGSFTIDGNKVTFANVLSTLRACPEVETSGNIDRVLADGCSFAVAFEKDSSADDVTIMMLRDSRNKSLLTLRRSDMNFLNGQWQVIKVGDRTFDNPEMNLFFDIPGMKVHGNTGCNYFNGDIYTDPTVGGSLNFGQLGVTRMACPDQDVETAMLVALEQVSRARLNAEGEALLTDNGGKTLLLLRPMDVSAD